VLATGARECEHVRVWEDGEAEPGAWNVEDTYSGAPYSTQFRIQLSAYVYSGNDPYKIKLDDLYIEDLGGFSLIDNDSTNYISLTDPTQVEFDTVTWEVAVRESCSDSALLDENGDPLAPEDLIDTEDGYQRTDYPWYSRTEGTKDGFEVHAGVDGAWWQLIFLGYDRALFLTATDSTEVTFMAGSRYAVNMDVGDDGVAITLVDEFGITMASHVESEVVPKSESYVGAAGTLLSGGGLAAYFHEIALDGKLTSTGEVIPEDEYEPVSGWNTEVVRVWEEYWAGGAGPFYYFTIAAVPVRGSVNVYDPDGRLLDYPYDWREVSSDSKTMEVDDEYPRVTVVYFLDDPTLERDLTGTKPSQDQEEQARKVSSVTVF